MDLDPGLMMDRPLLLKSMLWRAEHVFRDNELVTDYRAGSHRLRYGEYGDRVRRLASGLAGLGVQPGERVGTLAWNTGRHLEAYYAVPCMGAVLHTINLRLFAEQVAYTINHARDVTLLVDVDQLPLVEEIWERLTTVRHVIVLGDVPAVSSRLPVLEYEQLLASSPPVQDFPDFDERTAAATCYTSATTGEPKGVLYSHRSIVLHSLMTCASGSFGVSEDMTLLAISPMFHVNSWGLPHAAVLQGTKLVLPGEHPTPETYLQLIERERVTHAYGAVTVGVQIRDMIELDSTRYDLSTLRSLLLGGQAPPVSLMRFFDSIGVHVPQGWGMTETSPLVSWNYRRPRHRDLTGDALYDLRSTQGIPLPLVEVKLSGDDGVELPWDGETVGELMLRGPWVASGYVDDEVRSNEALLDGWLRTNDIGVIRPDGYIKLLDRSKDLIKSGGEWISSIDLENALMAHPDVHEAAVVAEPSERWVERPVAFIVPRQNGACPTKKQLNDFLLRRFAKWWLPDRYELVSEIPKTGVGKFDKKVLRRQLEAPET